MSLLDNLPHICSAYRRSRTRDALGGSKTTYGTQVFADRACWVQPLSSSRGVDFDRRGINSNYKVYFAENPGLDERDVIVWNGTTYLVVSTSAPDASAGLGVLWRVEIEVPPPPGNQP